MSHEQQPRYLPFMRPAVAGPWLFPVRLAPSPFGDQRALPSVGERPQPELLLGDLPEPRQAVRLDEKEEDDQGAEHHEFKVRDDHDGDLQPGQGWNVDRKELW